MTCNLVIGKAIELVYAYRRKSQYLQQSSNCLMVLSQVTGSIYSQLLKCKTDAFICPTCVLSLSPFTTLGTQELVYTCRPPGSHISMPCYQEAPLEQFLYSTRLGEYQEQSILLCVGSVNGKKICIQVVYHTSHRECWPIIGSPPEHYPATALAGGFRQPLQI